MASEKRDFANFDQFPGKITARNWYEFPTLYKIDSLDHTRVWNIFVRLIKIPKKMITDDEWDLLAEDEIPVKKEYLDGKISIPEKSIAQYWVETGIQGKGKKIMRKAPTYISGVLEDRANARNHIQEALVKARGLYLAQIAKGSKPKTDKQSNTEEKKEEISQNVRYFPMLARLYKQKKTIKYPCFVQPKLNGLRCITYYDTSSNEVILYSRNLKTISGFEKMREIMLPALKKMITGSANSLYLDGELYHHGMDLQDISGVVRNTEEAKKIDLQYYVFDCFYPNNLDLPYVKRLGILKKFFSLLGKNDLIVRVLTFEAKTEEEENKLFEGFLSHGFEGSMLKNKDGKYRTSSTGISSYLRSPDIVKHKPRPSEEYETVGFTSGKRGTNKDAIVWILQTSDGKRFHATPNMTLTKRKELLVEASKDFDGLFKGRMMTVEYDELSKDGTPLRAKAIAFRDE